MIRIDEHFDQTQDEVWAALVDPDRLSDWLGGPSSIEARVGGTVRLDLADDGVRATGVVRACSPPRPGFAVAHLEHTFVDEARPEQPTVCTWSVVRDEHHPEAGCDLHLLIDEPPPHGAGRAFEDRLRPPIATPVADAVAALRAARSVLLVDWIGPEVPRVLSRAVPAVYGKVSPGADDWALVEASDDDAGFRTTRIPTPAQVDLLHLDWTLGFEEFATVAEELGVQTFWYHSARTKPPAPADDRGCWVPSAQSARQRARIEGAGLRYIDDHFIADVAALLPEI